MNSLNGFIKALYYILINILNLLKIYVHPRDYFVNILKQNGCQIVKYTHNTVLVLTHDINYWFEIEYYENMFYINFCSNGKYIEIHNWYDYNSDYQQLKKIGDELILILNINDKWKQLLYYFKNNNMHTNNNRQYKYVLLAINSLKNTYVLELIVYFNKNLISIIMNYLLEN